MSEEQAKNGEEGQSKNIFDDLVEKTKVFADKASDIIEENIDKLKQSETYGKVTDFVEKQTEAYKSGEMEAKFSEMKENAGKKGRVYRTGPFCGQSSCRRCRRGYRKGKKQDGRER